MTFLQDYDELVTQVCYREAWSGQDDYAAPTYGTAVAHRCRVVHKPTMVRNVVAARAEAESAVREVVSSAQVWTDAVGWSTKDRITLPDGTQPQILEVRRYPDENGSYTETVLV